MNVHPTADEVLDLSIATFLKRVALTALLVVVTAASCGRAQQTSVDPFAAAVRPTPHQSPEKEQRDLLVPEGFEVQLVAAEPQIAKPLNMAFDARGRLWLTDTLEYPHPAPPDRRGRDTVKILEDTDGDGRADKVTVFADGLNIPIGLYPYGRGAIVFSIPNIWYLEDTDGDDRCDRRQVLYGPFGCDRDTHGLNNAFRRAFDGWLYACHGFNNHSEVAGRDGHKVIMDSGNTYRIRLDGSRIEHFTHGQVNPFGMTVDPLGNLFTADCHSKPVYPLLRGGYYPSFGKPHDGLGFVPPIMDHLHGSTAISGVVDYQADSFPADYRGNLLSGNVMTSRINRNRLTLAGSTYAAQQQADFLISKDPWFRPVDLQIGLDGALYVADFYNRIIGHYEVDLDHPGRDRTSGRIWRIVYRGETSSSLGERLPPASLPLDQLLDQLGDPNMTRRLLALNHLVDDRGDSAASTILKRLVDEQRPEAERVGCLWALHRLGCLSGDQLGAAATSSATELRVHAMKVLAETNPWSESFGQLARAGLQDEDPFVRRAAADALGQHPDRASAGPLLELLLNTSDHDPHLLYVVRRALCDQFRANHALADFDPASLDTQAVAALCKVTLGLPTPDAAEFLTRALLAEKVPPGHLDQYFAHVVRFGSTADLSSWIDRLEQQASGDPQTQLDGLLTAADAMSTRGEETPVALRKWAQRLAERLLDAVKREPRHERWAWWAVGEIPGQAGRRPWPAEARPSSDGSHDALYFSSLPLGEVYTGSWRSQDFSVPSQLSFFVAGHRGFPNEDPHEKNRVVLRDAVTGEQLAVAFPPRDDVAQAVTWNLDDYQGRTAHLEVVDGDDGTAYAWLAAGRFSLAPLCPAPGRKSLQQVCQLVERFHLAALRESLGTLLEDPATVGPSAVEIARALYGLEPEGRRALLVEALSGCPWDLSTRTQCLTAMLNGDPEQLREFVVRAFQDSGPSLRPQLVAALATDREGLELLLDLIEQGKVPGDALASTSMKQRLAAADESVQERAERLRGQLPSEDEQLIATLASRTADLRRRSGSPDAGRQIFQQHCAACHQLGGVGATIGPQLDGIGSRGAERVLEDILLPHRHVDIAFRTSTLVLENGQVLSGLVKQVTPGEALQVYDQQGELRQVPVDAVERRVDSPLSLMPDNFATVLAPQQLRDLVAYLTK